MKNQIKYIAAKIVIASIAIPFWALHSIQSDANVKIWVKVYDDRKIITQSMELRIFLGSKQLDRKCNNIPDTEGRFECELPCSDEQTKYKVFGEKRAGRNFRHAPVVVRPNRSNKNECSAYPKTIKLDYRSPRAHLKNIRASLQKSFSKGRGQN